MLTRNEWDDRYLVDHHGRIAAPGKFMGQMVYVPYFWLDAEAAGQVPEDGIRELAFVPTGKDREFFPELKTKRIVTLQVRNGEFVTEL